MNPETSLYRRTLTSASTERDAFPVGTRVRNILLAEEGVVTGTSLQNLTFIGVRCFVDVRFDGLGRSLECRSDDLIVLVPTQEPIDGMTHFDLEVMDDDLAEEHRILAAEEQDHRDWLMNNRHHI